MRQQTILYYQTDILVCVCSTVTIVFKRVSVSQDFSPFLCQASYVPSYCSGLYWTWLHNGLYGRLTVNTYQYRKTKLELNHFVVLLRELLCNNNNENVFVVYTINVRLLFYKGLLQLICAWIFVIQKNNMVDVGGVFAKL